MPKSRHKAIPHWIIPLRSNLSPYIKQIRDPSSYTGSDELAIPTAMLKDFKTVNTQLRALYSFEDIREEHQRCNKKMILKDMGKPFGIGAFAGSAGMQRGDTMIYSGIYVEEDKFKGSDHCYLAELFSNYLVDGKHIWSMGRYVQHLPHGEDYHRIADYDQAAAKENVRLKTCNASITLNGYTYIIPVSRLIVNEDIKAGEMLGFDYSSGYWNSQHILPSYFDRFGRPLYTIRLSMNCGGSSLTFHLARDNAQRFLEQRYLQYTFNHCFILPKSVTELAPAPTNAAYLPAIYHMSCDSGQQSKNKLQYRLLKHGDYILLPLKPEHSPMNETATEDLIKFIESLPCKTELTRFENFTELLIRLSDIANLEISDARRLFTRLTKEVRLEDNFHFNAWLDPVIQRKALDNRAADAVAALGLFNTRRSRRNNPASEAENVAVKHARYCV